MRPTLPPLAGLVLAAAILSPAAAQEAAPAAPLDRAAIERIVRETIVANPEIIIEALQALEAREQAASEKATVDAIAENRAELQDSKTSPVSGNPRGDVVLVEFFDYQCGFCKRAQPERMAAVAADGKVKLVFKEFPILGPGSVTAAKAALAAVRQGKYEPLHEALMEHQGPLTEDSVLAIAKERGLNVEKLKVDMESEAVTAEIDANLVLASKLGIRGTPAFVIGNQLIPGAIDRAGLADAFAQARKGG